MKYIDEINAFERWLDSNHLAPLSQLLWYKIFKLNNRAGWGNWVQIENLRLMAEMQIKREATFIVHRDTLLTKGLVEYKKGRKGYPNRYRIKSLCGTCTFTGEAQTVVDTEVQAVVQTVVQTVVDTVDISRLEKDKTKINKELIALFYETVWKAYPNKKGKAAVSDTQKAKLFKLGEETILLCVERYKQDKPDWQAFQNGGTFFNSGYVDYLDENYQESPAEPKNGTVGEDGRIYNNGRWVLG